VNPEVSNEDTGLQQGDKVVFTEAHHAMNSSLKQHKGDTGIVRSLDHGYKDKALVEFIEGSSKKVIDSWAIAPHRLTLIEDLDDGSL